MPGVYANPVMQKRQGEQMWVIVSRGIRRGFFQEREECKKAFDMFISSGYIREEDGITNSREDR